MLTRIALTLIAALSLSAAPALAVPVIDFSGTGTTGFVTSGSTVGSNAFGSGITINSFSVSDTPTGDGVYSVQNGFLSFDTGVNGNYVTITGGVSAMGISQTDSSGNATVLLSGTWDVNGGVGYFQSLLGGAQLVNVTGTGVDTKNSSILSYAGLPLTTPWAYFVLNISVISPRGYTLNANGTRTYAAGTTSADIVNVAIPEPGSLALLGTGLFGLAAAVRRRRRQAAAKRANG